MQKIIYMDPRWLIRLQHVVKSLNVIRLKRSRADCDPKPYSNWQLTKWLGQFTTHESATFLMRTTLAIDNGTANVLRFLHLCRESKAQNIQHMSDILLPNCTTRLCFTKPQFVTTFVHSSPNRYGNLSSTLATQFDQTYKLFCEMSNDTYTVSPKKHVTTFSIITLTISVRLQ